MDVGASRIQIASGVDAAATAGMRSVGYKVESTGAAILGSAAFCDANMDGVVNTLDLVLISSAGKFGSSQAAFW